MRPCDSASMVRAISLSTTETTCQAMTVEDDAGADRAEEKDRQRESKSGGSEELTERRHELYDRRRGPC